MTNKEASDRQEKMIANYLGWRQVSGSGSRPNHPGDIVSDEWMGECKTHVSPKHRITFKKKVWDKICEEAYAHHKSPAYFSDDGSQLSENTWVVIRSRLLPTNGNYEVLDRFGDAGDSISFDNFPNELHAHLFVRFNFNTKQDDLEHMRNTLFVTRLSAFRDLINLE